MTRDEAKRMQVALNEKGFGPIAADGITGPATRKAILRFQAANGLPADGIAGPRTLAKLYASTPSATRPIDQLARAEFYAVLRSNKAPMFGNALSVGQVMGMEGILDAFGVTGDGRIKTLAYGLATARREVGSGMVPVREGFCKTDAAARAYVAKHYPNKSYSKPKPPYGYVYYGRGLVQLTHDYNYAAAGILDQPDKALEPEWAARYLFAGLIDGRWNGAGKGIAHYLPTDGPDDLMNARRTVNLTDHWAEIAQFYEQFTLAIDAGLKT